MQRAHSHTRLTALALGITGALAFGQVQASGFQLRENSVKSMGNSFAGSGVSTGDTSVVVNNPATMTQFEGTTLQADVSVIDLGFEFTGGGTDVTGQPLAGGNGGDAGDVIPVPAMSVVHKLGHGVALGAMISAPFGLKTEYDDGWVGRYFGQTSEVEVLNLTLSAALDVVPDRVSVGVGLVYSHADVTLSRAVDFGSILFRAPLPIVFARAPVRQPQGADGLVEVQGDDSGIGWVAGVHLRPTDQLSIGVSHRSEIAFDLRGEADWTVPANARDIFDEWLGRGALFQDGPASAKLTTPAITSVDVAYQVSDRLALMATYAETGWESVQEVRIDFENPDPDAVEDFGWTTTRFIAIGGEYQLNDRWTLRAGVASDETPTTLATRAPRLPDENRRWLSLGATWQISDQLGVSFGYANVKSDTPQLAIVTPPAAGGQRLSGSYDTAVHMYGLSAQYRF